LVIPNIATASSRGDADGMMEWSLTVAGFVSCMFPLIDHHAEHFVSPCPSP